MCICRIVAFQWTIFLGLIGAANGALVVTPSPANSGGSGPSAAMVTTNETAVDGIFSQTSFTDVSMPIDIRFVTTQTFASASHLSIDNSVELDSLFNRAANADSPIVNMFFVDAIEWCNGPADPGFTIAGCANQPGHNMVLASPFAAGANGGSLAAHELGHNLGLDHVGDENSTDNLMNPVLGGSTTLTSAQVSSILASGLVQQETGGAKFIEVNTVLVTVPEPTSLLYLGLVASPFFGLRAAIRLVRPFSSAR